MLPLKSFNSLFDLITAFPDEQSCIDHLTKLRWKDTVSSPFIEGSTIYKCKKNRYKCRISNKYFNVRTGTMFEDSKVPLQKWFFAIHIISSHKKGISSHQLSRDIEVTQKTAWFMLQRIRKSMHKPMFEGKLTGVIEADETFVGGKNFNRHKDKKVPKAQGRSYKDKTPVFGLLQRNGMLYACVIPDTKLKTIQPIIHKVIEQGSTLMTDEWLAYNGLGRYFNHYIVDHSKKEYANGEAYTNTLEGAWSLLKRMIIGIYHKTSRKHLQLYVNEFVFRYNTRKFRDGFRFNELLDRTFSTRLTYNQLKYAS